MKITNFQAFQAELQIQLSEGLNSSAWLNGKGIDTDFRPAIKPTFNCSSAHIKIPDKSVIVRL